MDGTNRPEVARQAAGLGLVGGVVAGVLLAVLTVLAEGSGIGGHGWSLAGNGAVVVVLVGVPVALAVGGVALERRFRRYGGLGSMVGGCLAFVAGMAVGLVVAGAILLA